MTANTTDDVKPTAKTDPEITVAFKIHRGSATPLVVSTPPGPALPLGAAAPLDLELRIVTRRAEIITSLLELRDEAHDELKAKLSELDHILDQEVVDGWASIGDVAKHKLERWLTSK